jgi:spore coat protein U-like protein
MIPSRRLIAVAALTTLPAVSQAASTTTTFNVTATVIDVCAVSAGNLGFGTYNPISGSALDGTSTITVTCTLGTPYHVRLSAGANGGGVTTRKMLRTAGGSETLDYALYRDSNRTNNWGQTDNTDTLDQSGTGVSQGVTVYGRIPASTNVPPASYSDTVTVTISY